MSMSRNERRLLRRFPGAGYVRAPSLLPMLRPPGRGLQLTFVNGRPVWTLEPDGVLVDPQRARAAVASGKLEPLDPGLPLFGDDQAHAQSWVLRRPPEGEKPACASLQKRSAGYQEELTMDVREFLSGTHHKYDDVRNRDCFEVIDGACPSKYGGKLDLVFQSGNMLGLSAHNLRVLVRALGPESDDWRGTKVRLFAGQLEFNGEMKDSVLLEIVEEEAAEEPPKKKRTSASAASTAPLDDEIPFCPPTE